MTLTSAAVVRHIEADRVVATMRGDFPPAIALDVCAAIFEAGITAFEMTTNSTEPYPAMQAVKARWGDAVVVGMGTVLNAEMAREALANGADFVVGPSYNHGMVETVAAAGVLAVPGVMTPTEIADALAAGAGLLKLFPAGTLGVEYLKAVRGPFDTARFMCNGGITDENAAAFLKAGAAACGVAGWLTGDGHWPLEKVHARAAALKAAVTGGVGTKLQA